jgi:class 3 adenylate cyclase/tetratricopeptide (TPR) repeat protein
VRRFTALTDFQYTRGDDAVDAWGRTIEEVYKSFSASQKNELGKEGDAVISAFSLPQNALSSALYAQEQLAHLPEVYGPDENDIPAWQKLKMRIGLATGPCYIGHATSGNRRMPVFGGPVVDLAYSIEEASPVGGVAVDDKTKEAIPIEFDQHIFKNRLVWVPKTAQVEQILKHDNSPTRKFDEAYYKEEIDRLQKYDAYLDTFFPKQIKELVGTTFPGRYQPATVLFAQMPMLHEIVERAINKGKPDDVRAAYDAAFRALQPAIEGNGGIIVKMYKDKVIAGFGIPQVEEKAMRHARQMHKDLAFNWKDEELMRLAHKYHSQDLPFIVGAIHHGRNILTGILGTEERRGYDLLGDDVNVAARLAAQSMSTDATELRGAVRIIYSEDALKQDREFTLMTKRVADFVPKGKTQSFRGHVITSEEEKGAKKLIGRDKEVKQLDGIVNGLFNDGKSQVVHISAPPGYGKTELTKVLIEQFKAKNGEVYTANSLEFARDVPDHVMQGLVKNYLGAKDGQAKPELAKIVQDKVKEDKRGLVNQWLSLGLDYTGPSLSPAQLAEKRLETLAEMLDTGKKTLVVMNDVHWADADSLAKWQKLTERLQNNVLFATNYRDTDLPETYKPIVSTGIPIRIAEFDAEGTAQLLERLLESKPETKLVELAYKQSRGVPLYIEEVAAFLQQEQLVKDGRLTKDVSEIKVPGSIQDIILARYDKLKQEALGVDARRYLEFASAMYGDEWNKDFLGIKNKEEVLKLLVEKGFLQAQNGSIGWHHNLTKKAIYHNIRPEIRKRQHEAIGRLIESRYQVKTDQAALNQHLIELAYHFENSDDLKRGSRYNCTLARKSANEQQYKLAEKHSKIVEKILADKELDKELLSTLGYALNAHGLALERTGRKEEAITYYNNSLGVAKKLPEGEIDDLLLRINLNLASIHANDLEKFKPHYEAALALAKKKDTPSNRLQIATLYLNAGIAFGGEERIRLTQEAIEVLKDFGDTYQLAMAYISLSKPLSDKGSIEEAKKVAEKAGEIAERLKHSEMQGRSKYALAIVFRDQGFSAQAMQYFGEAEKFFAKSDSAFISNLYKEWVEFCVKNSDKNSAIDICKRWEQRNISNSAELANIEKTKKELGLSA